MPTHSAPGSLTAGLFGGLVALSCTLSVAGCVATLEPREPRPVAVAAPEEVTWVDSAPASNVEQYPHETYGGRDVYFIGRELALPRREPLGHLPP